VATHVVVGEGAVVGAEVGNGAGAWVGGATVVGNGAGDGLGGAAVVGVGSGVGPEVPAMILMSAQFRNSS